MSIAILNILWPQFDRARPVNMGGAVFKMFYNIGVILVRSFNVNTSIFLTALAIKKFAASSLSSKQVDTLDRFLYITSAVSITLASIPIALFIILTIGKLFERMM